MCQIITIRVNHMKTHSAKAIKKKDKEARPDRVVIEASYGDTVAVGSFRNRTDIREVVIGKGIVSIEDEAFKGCTALRKVSLPKSLRSIGTGAFAGCSLLTDIEFPEDLTKIGDHAFKDCAMLRKIRLPSGLESIGTGAFAGCKSIIGFKIRGDNGRFHVSNGVLYMDDTLIMWPPGCVDDNVPLLAGLGHISDGAFDGSGLNTI